MLPYCEGCAVPEADVILDPLRLMRLAVPIVSGVSFVLGLSVEFWQTLSL